MPEISLTDPDFDLTHDSADGVPGIPPPLNSAQTISDEIVSAQPTTSDYPEDSPALAPTPPLKSEEVIEKIVPKVDPVERILTYGDVTKTYTQRSLSVFRRLEFFGLLGRTIDEIVDGPDGVNIDAIFGDTAPGTINELTNTDIGELTTFVQAVAKIATYAPDFLKNAYLIILNVPHNEKDFASFALDEIDDDLFEDILTTFIDQNYKELESFFTERGPRILGHIQNLRNPS